jgi:hypothetical protein
MKWQIFSKTYCFISRLKLEDLKDAGFSENFHEKQETKKIQ